jgi:imidazole glycerol-phosphate synthase subunit HisF
MRRIRVIPTLLIDSNGGLVKTIKFGKRTYLGDPINAVKIFNEKEVDELVLLDIDASKQNREPNYSLIEEIVSEAFMPIGYGGGISSMSHAQQLFRCGLEKIVISSALYANNNLIQELAARYGAQSVVVSLDVKKNWLGRYKLTSLSGSVSHDHEISAWAKQLTESGAGEVLIQSIDRDGTYAGYDVGLLKTISESVDVPVIASGGASNISNMLAAVQQGGSSAVAAGSLFVYQGSKRGILINYPTQQQLKTELFGQL